MTRDELTALDVAVQELRVAADDRHFTRQLAHIVSVFEAAGDGAPVGFAPEDFVRLRELANETIAAIEQRIDASDDERMQQRLAETIYELRRRMEVLNGWFAHFEQR